MIKFYQNNGITLPLNYNHILESAIYRSISPALADFLHQWGFSYGKRSFKLFTFSRLLGEYRIEDKKIHYSEYASLLVSSPIQRFIKELADGILKNGGMKVGTTKLNAYNIKFPAKPEMSSPIRGRTLSPITVYTTLLTKEGDKKTYYYSPYEDEFNVAISTNAKRKVYILRERNIKSNLTFKPYKMKEVIMDYKGTVVKGWYGYFELRGSKSLISITYDAGLGSKNSEGFGMYEVF
ncbi:MAG: CRISPR-associated endoribonuclease Cas6 [Candidatus Parvarchaeota archaeon]